MITMGERLTDESLATFTWTETEKPSEAVVRAISEVAQIDPLEATPLYDVVDPDALDSLFASAKYTQLTGCVQFSYLGYLIVIEANGQGHIYEQEGRGRSTAEPANAQECP